VTGNLSLASATFNINASAGDLTESTYKLITYTGTLTGNTSGWSINNNNASGSHSYSFSTSTAGEVDLLVGPIGAPNKTWAVDGSGNWSTADTGNWNPVGAPNVAS